MKRILTVCILVSLLFSSFIVFGQAKIKVACIGDSITEGWSIPDGKKYPEVLQQLLGDQYEVRNYGVGGRTLLRKGDFPYWNEKKYQEALDWQPDIVVIKLGTNDSKPQNWKYHNEFRKDYIDFIKTFLTLPSHPKVYVSYPIPVFESKWGITESIVKNEIIPAIKKAGKKTKTKHIDLYTPFEGRANLTYDGVHPNAEGCALLASEVYKVVRP
jgi:lysophospholipase L1-like esterase